MARKNQQAKHNPEMAREQNLQLGQTYRPPPRSIEKSLKSAVHTYLPLASKVSSPGVRVASIRLTNRALTRGEVTPRAAMGSPVALPLKMTFPEWLAAGVLEVPSGEWFHPHITPSRKIIIKLIANVLRASHPAGMEDSEPLENKFDRYIHDLHGITLADGYPVTFYQLLAIAGEMPNALKISARLRPNLWLKGHRYTRCTRFHAPAYPNVKGLLFRLANFRLSCFLSTALPCSSTP